MGFAQILGMSLLHLTRLAVRDTFRAIDESGFAMNFLTVEKERYLVPKFVEMRKIITESGARIKSTSDSVGHTWFGVMLGNLVASRIWRRPIGMGLWTKRFEGVDPQQSERVLQTMLRMGYLEDITRGRSGKDADGNVRGAKALIRPSFEVMNLVEWSETHLSSRGCHQTARSIAYGEATAFKSHYCHPSIGKQTEADAKFLWNYSQYVHGKTNAPTNRGFVRRYGENLFTGGRIDSDYQHLSKEDRAKITIKGEVTEELDYPENHPRILAAVSGFDLAGVYEVVPWCTRAEGKLAVNIILNSPNPEATMAHTMEWTMDKIVTFFAIMREEFPELMQYSGKQVGLQLQYIESEIIMGLMRKMHKQREVCLPVHDSLIVRREIAPTVRSMMADEWQSVVSKYQGIDLTEEPKRDIYRINFGLRRRKNVKDVFINTKNTTGDAHVE